MAKEKQKKSGESKQVQVNFSARSLPPTKQQLEPPKMKPPRKDK